MNGAALLAFVEPIIFAMLIISLGLAFFRLVRGPSLSDRVVALDLVAIMAVGFMAMYALNNDQPVFLDAAIILALIAFLGTVAFARYLERRAHDE